MRLFILITFFVFISVNQTLAQRDTLFITEYHHKLIVKLFTGGPGYSLEFTPRLSPDSTYSSYESNTYGIIGTELAYKSFSLNLSTRAGDLNDPDVYGKTKYTSFSARVNLHKISFEGSYKNFKGFADLNTRHYLKSSPDSSPYIVRNDLKNKYFKLKASYQFSDKKFSQAAAFSFTERQRKSAATLFLMGNINRFYMDADSSFFPWPVRDYYKDLKSMTHLQVTGVGTALGGAFTLVWKKFFFSGIVFWGAELQHQKYFLPENHGWHTSFRVAPLVDSRFSIGVNGNKAFIALVIKNDINNLQLTGFKSKTVYTMGTLDVGFRFNAPKIVEKGYSRAQQLIHKVF